MKWENKGHEYDRIGNKLAGLKFQDIYIYGAGEYGLELYHKIKFLDITIKFVDSDVNKQANGHNGIKVISPNELLNLPKNHIVVVCASYTNTTLIMKKLITEGYIEGENLFSFSLFSEFYLPLISVYVYNKLYFNHITLIMTEKCTLRCKKCAPMYPYLKDSRHMSFEDLKKDIDILFHRVDYIYDFILTGGEPFLNPSMYDVIYYLKEKYIHKFNHIQIITNGTVIPEKELLDLLKSINVILTVSKYVKSVPNIKGRYQKFINKLKEYELRYDELEVEYWSDFGFDSKKEYRINEEMVEFFDRCASTCRGFGNGKFIFCMPARYAKKVLMEDEYDENNMFISNCNKQMLEFEMGYSKKGYLDMCTECNGYITINKNYVQPAEQLDKTNLLNSKRKDIKVCLKTKH